MKKFGLEITERKRGRPKKRKVPDTFSKWGLLKKTRDEKVYPVKSCLAHTGEAGISPKAKLFNRTRKTGIKMLVKSIFIISGKRD